MNGPFRLSHFLPYRLAVLSERVSRRLSVEYERSLGITVAEWRVLVHLHRSGQVSVRDIQAYTNLEKSRVSRAVSRLQAAGLVEKSSSTADARLLEIGLSPQGEAALARILPQATQVEDNLLATLTPEEIETFFQVVEKLHTVLDADPDAPKRAAKDSDP